MALCCTLLYAVYIYTSCPVVVGMSSVRRGFTPLPVSELKAIEARCILQEVNVDHSRLRLGSLIMQGGWGGSYVGHSDLTSTECCKYILYYKWVTVALSQVNESVGF